MKKIIISGVAVLAIAAAATLNVNLNKRSNDLSGISLANVEALGQCEDKVERINGLIITTVCRRKTSIADTLFKIKCGTDSETTCSYSNVG